MPLTEDDPRSLEEKLVPVAGAFLPARDATDEHFLAQFAMRKSKLPHVKGSVWKPYGNENDNMELYEMWENKDFPPPASGTTARVDSDKDGMPDEWEIPNNLNPNRAADGPADDDHDGFTNLEEFLYGTDPHAFVDYTQAEDNQHTLH